MNEKTWNGKMEKAVNIYLGILAGIATAGILTVCLWGTCSLADSVAATVLAVIVAICLTAMDRNTERMKRSQRPEDGRTGKEA